jgi:hypothetical protein
MPVSEMLQMAILNLYVTAESFILIKWSYADDTESRSAWCL